MQRVNDASAYAYAFDILAIDRTDTRALPLSEPKAMLAKLLRRAKPGIRYSEHLAGNGAEIFQQAAAWASKAFVAKRLNSHYRSGKVKTWLKIKTWLKVKNPKSPAVMRIVAASEPG